MSVVNHRGPIGLDDHFSWLEPDYSDPPFDVTAFLYHGNDITPGPHGTPATVDSLGSEQQFAQQVSMPATQATQRISPAEFADLFHNIQVGYFNPRTGMANSVTIDVHNCTTITGVLFYNLGYFPDPPENLRPVNCHTLHHRSSAA